MEKLLKLSFSVMGIHKNIYFMFILVKLSKSGSSGTKETCGPWATGCIPLSWIYNSYQSAFYNVCKCFCTILWDDLLFVVNWCYLNKGDWIKLSSFPFPFWIQEPYLRSECECCSYRLDPDNPVRFLSLQCESGDNEPVVLPVIYSCECTSCQGEELCARMNLHVYF